MSHGDWFQVGHSCFEHAALVSITAFAGILVAYVHFHACHAVAVSIERLSDDVAKALLHVSTKAYVIVVIHLYLHVVLLNVNGIRPKRCLSASVGRMARLAVISA